MRGQLSSALNSHRVMLHSRHGKRGSSLSGEEAVPGNAIMVGVNQYRSLLQVAVVNQPVIEVVVRLRCDGRGAVPS